MKPLLEICIDSRDSALAAKQGGADRIEVCSALAIGGTTPSIGLMEECVNVIGLPAMIMIRPHNGGFVYSHDDLRIMERNIATAKSIGVQGVVFGALTPDDEVDFESCKRLLDASQDLETTFHRAIDLVKNPRKSLAELESLGFDRVLTSGQQPTAEQGAELIQSMVQQSKTISVMAGSGVNAQNALHLVRQTGAREIHASASVPATSPENRESPVVFAMNRRITCANKVQAIKRCFD